MNICHPTAIICHPTWGICGLPCAAWCNAVSPKASRQNMPPAPWLRKAARANCKSSNPWQCRGSVPWLYRLYVIWVNVLYQQSSSCKRSNLTIKFRWKKSRPCVQVQHEAKCADPRSANSPGHAWLEVARHNFPCGQPATWQNLLMDAMSLDQRSIQPHNPPSSQALIGINGKLNFKPSVNSSPKDQNLKKPFGPWLSCVLLLKKQKGRNKSDLETWSHHFKCHISAKALSPEFRCQQCHEAVRGCTWWHHTFCNKNGW